MIWGLIRTRAQAVAARGNGRWGRGHRLFRVYYFPLSSLSHSLSLSLLLLFAIVLLLLFVNVIEDRRRGSPFFIVMMSFQSVIAVLLLWLFTFFFIVVVISHYLEAVLFTILQV
jgi:hypothetical protein